MPSKFQKLHELEAKHQMFVLAREAKDESEKSISLWNCEPVKLRIETLETHESGCSGCPSKVLNISEAKVELESRKMWILENRFNKEVLTDDWAKKVWEYQNLKDAIAAEEKAIEARKGFEPLIGYCQVFCPGGIHQCQVATNEKHRRHDFQCDCELAS